MVIGEYKLFDIDDLGSMRWIILVYVLEMDLNRIGQCPDKPSDREFLCRDKFKVAIFQTINMIVT